MLTPDQFALILLLTDKAITTLSTLRQVNQMTPEQVKERIKIEEELTKLLMNELFADSSPIPSPPQEGEL